jgi:hypothetical protein
MLVIIGLVIMWSAMCRDSYVGSVLPLCIFRPRQQLKVRKLWWHPAYAGPLCGAIGVYDVGVQLTC